jgi:hypothetical protein
MKIREVSGCDDCPGLWQNSEFPQSRCNFADRSWGLGYHRHGDPTPEWCPLKTASVLVKIRQK